MTSMPLCPFNYALLYSSGRDAPGGGRPARIWGSALLGEPDSVSSLFSQGYHGLDARSA
jgi:hypothetical protein